MWDSITSVDQTHDPVIYEGAEPATIVVTSVGPTPVALRPWNETHPSPDASPTVQLELRSGNTKAVRGALVRVRVLDTPVAGAARFAAIGWRIVR